MLDNKETAMNQDERAALARAVMTILDNWGLNAAQQVTLLNLPDKTPTRMLRRYRDDTPLPDTREVNERVEHIIGIVDALRTTYPHNPSMGQVWMKQKNKRFSRRAPVHVMVEDGLDGLVAVRSHLDCAYDWFNS
ncbi:MAG: DUF2384 domain-containing protein [Proteobacteria bacterium]|jgi:hypothetical protein|nr:DUF2384 domain-containing protein [Pseudomonadota bacterium]